MIPFREGRVAAQAGRSPGRAELPAVLHRFRDLAARLLDVHRGDRLGGAGQPGQRDRARPGVHRHRHPPGPAAAAGRRGRRPARPAPGDDRRGHAPLRRPDGARGGAGHGAAAAVAVRPAGLARGHGHRILQPGPDRADGRDRAGRSARQRELAVRPGRLGDQDRRPGAGRGAGRPGRPGRGGGGGRGNLRRERAGLSLLRLPSARPENPGTQTAARSTLRADLAEGWTDFRTRTWLWAQSVQFAFINLLTWAPWMLLGPVEGHAYLGGAAVWGAIMAVQGAGAIAGGLACLGRRPQRPMMVAVIATFGYALPDIPMALHATAPWVALGAFGSTTMQQQIPPDRLARVSSLTLFSSYGIGVVGYAVDGPLAAAIGPATVFGVGAVYGLLSSAVVLALPAIRAVRWRGEATAACEPRPAGRRTPPAARPR